MTTSINRPAAVRRSVPTRLHAWIEDAAWQRPGLDRLARLGAGAGELRAASTRVPTPPRAPRATHRVSVVIPCFNYARFLPDAVASALEQDHAEMEVIVVDDASTDDSLRVATELAAADGRVQVLANPVNLGHVRTFNRGCARAGGEFVIRLDADDLLTPGSVARALALFEEFPRVGLVYGHPRHFTSVRPPAPRTGDVAWSVHDGASWVAERCRQAVNCITTPEAVVRASVLDRVGPLNTNLRFAQDMEMWLRVASVSDVGHVDDVDQALHRDHDASMSVNDGSGELTDLVERRQVFRELFASTGADLAGSSAMQRDCFGALAREGLGRALYSWDRGRDEADERAELVGFARETWPDVVDTPQWATLHRRLARPVPRRSAAALARVARRRLHDELMFLRWARTGL